ncbi:MAG: methionyl-tRNA formyltransferase [Coriobacteriia bacterium]|nr:methionyl-tRNA formyltransferase [Coriobacteriia bacterium]
MNIVFMGTPTIALPTLNALAEKHQLSAVFSRPDAVSHRGREKLPSLVKARALELGITCYTPRSFYVSLDNCKPLFNNEGQRVVDADILSHIERSAPDLIVVVAYGMILPAAVLEIPKHGCINIHASLLPQWRGAAPIQRALLAGQDEVGISIMRMETDLDTGPYCLQAKTSAKGKNYQQLIVEMGAMGAELLVPNLEAIVAGEIEWVKQDGSLATHADKVLKGSIDLDNSLTVQENHNRVRASSHHARCRTTVFDKSIMVLMARPAEELNDKSLYYKCLDGWLEITQLKPDGGKEMTGTAFVAGRR